MEDIYLELFGVLYRETESDANRELFLAFTWNFISLAGNNMTFQNCIFY